MGTFTGLSRQAGPADASGSFPRLPTALIVEGAGAVVGGATSASSNTVFIESGTGIGEGARTGLAHLMSGAPVLAPLILAPLILPPWPPWSPFEPCPCGGARPGHLPPRAPHDRRGAR